MIKGNITGDKRYSILMLDTLPNGVNYPTQAIYDDDPDMTQLDDWTQNPPISYDMYGLERGHGDALPSNGMFDPNNPIYVKCQKRQHGTSEQEHAELAYGLPHIKDQRVCKNCQSYDICPETEFR